MLDFKGKFSLSEVEKKVLEFWKENKVFEKSLFQAKKRKKFVFYEGPPTANGRPGLHHVLARAFKDIILRYKTMRGYHVPRKGGWDTHGLPVELEVEKSLGISSKKGIEKFGISAFNKKCRESVWKYKDEWERLTERMGFWLDLKNPYITYENYYIETIWHIFSLIWGKGLLYKGHKVVPWCPRCGTALSSHELALGYREVEEISVYVKFKLTRKSTEILREKIKKRARAVKSLESAYVLSWTTTPWTLPGNVALAVSAEVEYTLFEAENEKGKKENYIIALPRKDVLKGNGKQLASFKGKDLIGLEYRPLFNVPFFNTKEAKKTSYKIYAADFVTTEDGTGVVHTAVMYGEDDYQLGQKAGLPKRHTVNERGEFVKEIPGGIAGKNVKDSETEKKIISILKKQGLLLREEPYTHEYPFCWRCGSALIYYGRDSWFVKMSVLRKKLLEENKKINWIPAHVKNGRFGEWLKDVKDWAVSRERYWGTPLPIWECLCGNTKIIGSVHDLRGAKDPAGNFFVFMRHGEAENNTRHLMSSWPEKEKLHLTKKGRRQVEKTAKKITKMKIDMIFASDLTRTRETAEIASRVLGVSKVAFDARLREFSMGDFNGRTYEEYKGYFSSREEKFVKNLPNGENFTELRARIFDFLKDINGKYKNKNILVISHDACVWMMHSIANGWSTSDQLREKEKRGEDYIKNAGFESSKIANVPRDETGSFDLHRPYIDSFEFACDKCGGNMKRISEVADVWFDSGAMPFAEYHWPFEEEKPPYPADYISEAMDQTRGWFYTLLAIGVALGVGTPYKNVISLGLILDKYGQKMSKSKGNVVDPWAMMEKHGSDAIRWHFYTVNSPGEPKRFDESDVADASRRVFSLLYNSRAFLNLYGPKKLFLSGAMKKKENVLDAWMLIRFKQTAEEASKKLDEYEINDSARAIESLIDDISRWYVRRSRKRFQKPKDKKDYSDAVETLSFVLTEAAKIMAPFSPFFAEALYKSIVRNKKDSVHLSAWPNAGKVTREEKLILHKMEEVRKIASKVLAKRADLGIKVRQPLSSVSVLSRGLILGSNDGRFLDILKEEVNVKEITFSKEQKDDILLNAEITPELKEEGDLRDIIRVIQGLRQDSGFHPKNSIELSVSGGKNALSFFKRNAAALKRETGAKIFKFSRTEKFTAEAELILDGEKIWIGIRKI